jgi:hypothetical protein
MPWTHFHDMHSGGGTKEKYGRIFIEAPQAEAEIIFQNRFGHNPNRVSCTCCGPDYSTSEYESLEDATGYERNCECSDDGYIEVQRQSNLDIRRRCNTAASDSWGLYMTLDQYIASGACLVIRANEIKPEERVGELREQGYVWRD